VCVPDIKCATLFRPTGEGDIPRQWQRPFSMLPRTFDTVEKKGEPAEEDDRINMKSLAPEDRAMVCQNLSRKI
jgi:hypothetical protein